MKYEFDSEENQEVLYDAFNKKIREDSCNLYEVFEICKEIVPEAFLEMVVTLITSNVVDIFAVKGFQQVGIDEYLQTHIQMILESGKEIIWTKYETCEFILETYKVDDLLDYFSPTGMVYLSQMMKHGGSGIVGLITAHLNQIFSPELPKSVVKNRLAKLVRKDQNDLTFLDYAFHRKALQIIAMLEELKKSLQGTEDNQIEFYIPQMIKVVVELKEKPDETCLEENKTLESYKNLLADAKFPENHQKLFDQGHGNYIDRIGKDTQTELKKFYDYFVELSAKLKKEFFRFFKIGESATYEYISTADHLQRVVDQVLLQQPFVTVDVEFCHMEVVGPIPEDENFRHHVACSLQISTLKQNYFIDCLALKNECKQPVAKLFSSREVLKVFHGCDSDLDAIYRTFGVIVENIFDTARAAVVIHDLENTPGLHALSLQYLKVHLDKSFQQSIWRVRPLPEPMLEYAITDSYVLLPIFYAQLTALDNLADVSAKSAEIWQHSNNIPKFIRPTAKLLSFV